MNDSKTNLELYESWRSVPAEAKKPIKGGKLAGKTDINPVWRVKVLTERFGPCGQGWYMEEVERWTNETSAGEVGAYVKIHLYYKTESGEWSRPVIGIGGNKLVGKGVGTEQNDEAWKMAFTDAMSVACKHLGIAADVYFEADRTKYTLQEETALREQKNANPGQASGGRPQQRKQMITMQALHTGAHSKEVCWLAAYNPADKETYANARNSLWGSFEWESQEVFFELEKMAAGVRKSQQGIPQTQNS